MNAAPAITFSLDKRELVVFVVAVFFENTAGDFAINPVLKFAMLKCLGIANIIRKCYGLIKAR